MKLTDLVKDPTKLETHGKFISPEERWERILQGDTDPKLVKIIATDPHFSYWYARDIIKGRWPEGEIVVAKDPWYAYMYAKNVIEGRFPEGEPTLERDPNMWRMYNDFLKWHDRNQKHISIY